MNEKTKIKDLRNITFITCQSRLKKRWLMTVAVMLITVCVVL